MTNDVTLFFPEKNKIFQMQKSSEDSFLVIFGQIGKTMLRKSYPMHMWSDIYEEKRKLGYIDQTSQYSGAAITLNEEVLAKDRKLNRVLLRLKKMSRQIVSENYKVSEIAITDKMLEEAEKQLEKMEAAETLWSFNESLLRLFAAIPRRMSKVIVNTAKNTKEFDEILEREKELLRNLKVNNGPQLTENGNMIYEACSEKELLEIRDMLDESSRRKFSNAWKVTNLSCEKAFQSYLKEYDIQKTKLLFHGSRSENWWSILQTKLMKKPTNAISQGSMFGAGIYFAPKAAKSVNYTSLLNAGYTGGTDMEAYMGIYEVAYGNPLHVEVWEQGHTLLSEQSFQKKYPGKHCLHAHAGKSLLNDEIIIYNENACSIRYLVELKR